MKQKIRYSKRNVLSLLLALCMIVTMVPQMAFAGSNSETLSEGIHIYAKPVTADDTEYKEVTGQDVVVYMGVNQQLKIVNVDSEGVSTELTNYSEILSQDESNPATGAADIKNGVLSTSNEMLINTNLGRLTVSHNDKTAFINVKHSVQITGISVSGNYIPEMQCYVYVNFSIAKTNEILNYIANNVVITSNNQDVVSNESISVKVIGNRKVGVCFEPLTEGTVKLEAELDGTTVTSDEISIEVPNGFYLKTKTYYMQPDESITINCIYGGNKTPNDTSWTSEDKSIATVDNDGTISGVSNGTTTITATNSGIDINIEVNVAKDGIYRLNQGETNSYSTIAVKEPIDEITLDGKDDNFTFAVYSDAKSVGGGNFQVYSANNSVIAAPNKFSNTWSPVNNGETVLYVYKPYRETGTESYTDRILLGTVNVTVKDMDNDANEVDYQQIVDGKTAVTNGYICIKDTPIEINVLNDVVKDNYLTQEISAYNQSFDFEIRNSSFKPSDKMPAEKCQEVLTSEEYKTLYTDTLKQFVRLEDSEGNTIATPDNGLDVVADTKLDNNNPVADVKVTISKQLNYNAGYRLIFDYGTPTPYADMSIEQISMDHTRSQEVVSYDMVTGENPSVIEIDAAINKLPEIITVNDYEAVQAIVDAYAKLPAEEKAKIDSNAIVSAQKALTEALKEASIIDISHYVSTITATRAYTGKEIKAAVTVSGVDPANYDVKYTNNIKIGVATAKITGKNGYKGTITKTFRIVPAKAGLSKVKPAKRKLTAYVKKQAGGVKYQFYIKQSGKAPKYYRTTSTKKIVKKLKSKKYYTVKVRAYKTVNGKTYYGSWSAAKKVKVK